MSEADKVVLKKLSQLKSEYLEEGGKMLTDMIEATCQLGDFDPDQLLEQAKMLLGGDPAFWEKKSEELKKMKEELSESDLYSAVVKMISDVKMDEEDKEMEKTMEKLLEGSDHDDDDDEEEEEDEEKTKKENLFLSSPLFAPRVYAREEFPPRKVITKEELEKYEKMKKEEKEIMIPRKISKISTILMDMIETSYKMQDYLQQESMLFRQRSREIVVILRRYDFGRDSLNWLFLLQEDVAVHLRTLGQFKAKINEFLDAEMNRVDEIWRNW